MMCFDNTVLCFDNSLLCSDNTMLCLEKCLLCFKNCLLCLQIWATVSIISSTCFSVRSLFAEIHVGFVYELACRSSTVPVIRKSSFRSLCQALR